MDSYVDAAFRMQAACTAPIADDRRQLGPRPAGVGDPGAEPRRAPRARPVLRSLAQGRTPTAPIASRPSSGSSASTPSPSPSRRACPAAGGPRPPTRTRPPRAATGRSPAASCRWSAGSWQGTGGGAETAGVDRYRHRPTVGTRAALSWGAGGPPERARPRPPPRREPRADLHVRSAGGARGDPWRARGRAAPRRLGAGRDGRRPPGRRRPGRDVGAGLGRDPQPHPSAIARDARAARPRARGGDPGRHAAGRLPIPPGTPDPGVRGVFGVARHLAVAATRDLRAPSRAGPSLPADPAGRAARRRTWGRRRFRPSRRPRPTSRRSAAKAARTHRSGRSRPT